MNLLSNEVKPKSFTKLGEGSHNVCILSWSETNDRCKNLKGDAKDAKNLPPWTDSIDQVAVTFGAQGKDSGVITRRYVGTGYRKWEDLTDAEKASGMYTCLSSSKGQEMYACLGNKEKGFRRIEDPAKSEKAVNVFNDLMLALGAKEGDDPKAVLDSAVANWTKIQITVAEHAYEGAGENASSGTSLDVTHTKAIKVAVKA
jgi:hypothetical protein